eukprot:COSAG05_NODE_17_length_35518_cov_34.728084_16_plen_89_part_00
MYCLIDGLIYIDDSVLVKLYRSVWHHSRMTLKLPMETISQDSRERSDAPLFIYASANRIWICLDLLNCVKKQAYLRFPYTYRPCCVRG